MQRKKGSKTQSPLKSTPWKVSWRVPCKIYPIFFRVAKAPEIFQGMVPIFFQGHCYSKKEEAAWPLLFLNNNDPFFFSGCHPRKSQVSCQPEKNKAADFTGYPSNNFQGCRLNGGFSPVGMLEFQPIRGNYISSNVCRSDKNWAP